MQKNVNLKNNIYGLTFKATESAIKYGAEVATACDPVAAAIALGGKLGVGASLSKFSASQCAGLIGVIVSSITPQVIKLWKFIDFSWNIKASVPILLKKIAEDLDYLKESIDIVREGFNKK